ncbi:MAG TPA: metal transporter [Gemmatimonadota bacterium]|nr:metal transporter [Gemmatimonadota bacterium]
MSAKRSPRAAKPSSPAWSGAVSLAVSLTIVAALVGLLAFLLARGVGLERAAPPLEELTIERVELPAPGRIRVHVVNGGQDAVTIHQVAVDEAIWAFTIQPAATIGRLGGATIEIPYPWVEGEAHEVVLISRNGVTFEAPIEVATETPQATAGWFLRLALLGFYVGVIPVALGLATYPFLARLGARGIDFLLALTVGLLVFLAIDTLMEALELAGRAAEAFHAPILVWIVSLSTLAGLLALTARRRSRGQELSGVELAGFIAFGIGLHNMGEGLAIGAALASGAVGLGTFLVVGFTLHNITEGIGIAAPLLKARPRLLHFVGLALLAGGPAILGCWIGGLVFDPLWAAIFLAVGAGAILQVVWEVGRLVAAPADGRLGIWRGEVLAGAALGLILMYATALIVPA